MEPFVTENYFDLNDFAHRELFEEIKSVWEALEKIKSYLSHKPLGSCFGHVSENAYLVNPELITIGKGTIVEPGAYIKGPCIIGENCTIRHGAYLRGDVITGNHCVIGHDTEVKNSIFLNKASAAHFAYVGNSIIGNNCNLGAGTKCANLRFDNKNIVIHFEGQKIVTGSKKLGLILGDRAQTGCNSVSNPGTLVGKGSFCYPCTHFSGVIPEGSIVKNEAPVQIFQK